MTIEDIREYKNNAVEILRKHDQYATAKAVEEAFMALACLGQYMWERDVAISQLEELGLSLGQKVDHVKETIDKQVTKDVIAEKYFYGENYYCPCCKNYLGADHNNLKDVKYCDKCGQKINIKQQ